MSKSIIAVFLVVVSYVILSNVSSAPASDNLSPVISANITPSVELINSRSKEVARGDLSDEDKSLLSDLYSQSISSLGLTETHRKKALVFSEIIQTSNTQLQKIKAELLNASQQSAASSSIDIDLPLYEIEQNLQKLKADLALSETRFNELKNQLSIEKDRPVKVRQRLLEVKKQLSELSLLLSQPDSETASPEINEAQSWANITLQEQLRTEALMLEQELSSHPARIELLTAKFDLAEIELSNSRNKVNGFEEAANQIRLGETEKAKADAIKAEREAASKHPLVAHLATQNTTLSEQIDLLANEIENINKDEVEATESANRIEEAFNTTRKKLDIAGLSQVLGQVLQQEKRALPDTRHFQKLTSIREQKIADTSLSQIQLEQERRELRNINSYVDALSTSLSAQQSFEIKEELAALAKNRKDLIDNALSVQRAYLQAIVELDISQRRQQTAVENYSDFLGKRLLWIRSTEQVSWETVKKIPEQISHLFSPSRWQNFIQTLISDVLLETMPSLALVFALVVLVTRPKIWQQLRNTGTHIGNLRLDRVTYTMQAIAWILILALPGPVLMMAIGWELGTSFEASNFSKMVSNTLMILAPLLFHLSAFRLFLAPGSIAQVHYGWQHSGVKKLHHDLNWFTPITLGLTFVVTLAFQDNVLGSGSGLGRAIFIFLMLTFAIFFFRLAKPHGGTIAILASGKPDSILIRFRHLWFVLFVGPPVASILVSLAGYMFTAGTLIERILQSTWFALLVIVIHQFILRWLTLNQRRLRLEAAKIKRRTEQEARANRETEEEAEGMFLREIEEPEVDLGALSITSHKLLNNTLILVGLVGIWLIWRDVLPALQILNDITLWNYTHSDNEIIPITLSSLILALLVIIITVVATRQLPAFIEIVLLQRLDMSQGSRYTVTTLTRYTIIAVGTVWVFSFLGGSWSEIQWIFAALGVGIGFGLQEIVANFISGLIILFERPIRVGDVVTVGNTDGVVTRIQIRATTIRNFDRKELLVPNKNFITQELLNWSLSDQTTRIMIEVGIAYGSDAQQALKILEEVASEHHRVMHDPAPFTVFESFGDNALLLSLRCYIDDIDYRLRTITEINLEINKRMTEAGIEIAFPQRDIHLDTRKPLDIRLYRDKENSD